MILSGKGQERIKLKTDRYAEYKFAKGWASVSTITGQLEKPFLYIWYAKYGVEAHRINDHSKKIGNLIDNDICHYFEDKDVPEVDRSVLKHKESNQYYLQAIQNFHKVVNHYKMQSVMGQQVVYSMDKQYIGTFDRLIIVDDKLVLSDWKATNYVSYEYEMQLEAYYRALTECLDKGIIVLEDKYKKYKWHEFPLWLVQFPKKEEVNLEKNILKFKSSDLAWNNFNHLLNFYYGKKEALELKKLNKPKRRKKNDESGNI